MKKLFLIVVIILLVGCVGEPKYYSFVEQEVELNSYIDCSYRVVTTLWVKERFLLGLNSWVEIEKSLWASYVALENVESVKERQLRILEPIKQKLDIAIANGTCKIIEEE